MRSVDTLCMGLAVFSGLILASIIGLTFTDVILRYIFLSLAFPFTWRAGGHIVVDLLPDYRIATLTVLRDLIVRLFGIGLFGLLAWQCWIRADDAVLFNEATNMIEIPFSPFFIVIAAASAWQVVVLCVECVRLVAGASLSLTVTWADAQEDTPSSD